MPTVRLIAVFLVITIFTLQQTPPAFSQTIPCFPITSTGPSAGPSTAEAPEMAAMVAPRTAMAFNPQSPWHSKALEGCGKLKSLINTANSKLLGFDTVQDVLLTHIGTPTEIYTVGLNKLRAYQPGDPVTPLIKQLDSRMYPLSVNGIVRSALVVSQIQNTNQFTTTAWGLVTLITLTTKYKKADSDFVVWIPVLNLHFLGNRPDETLMLTPLATRKLYGLTEGVAVQAAVVFALLAQQARAYDENNPG